MNRRPVADFGGCRPLSFQQRAIAGFRLATLMVGTGDIDPVPALPFRGRYCCRAYGRGREAPVVDPDYTATVGLDRALLAAADHNKGLRCARAWRPHCFGTPRSSASLTQPTDPATLLAQPITAVLMASNHSIYMDLTCKHCITAG
jgi:hypothetical protein